MFNFNNFRTQAEQNGVVVVKHLNGHNYDAQMNLADDYKADVCYVPSNLDEPIKVLTELGEMFLSIYEEVI